jgi:hypothetical protein
LSLLTKSRVDRYANLQIETPTLSAVPGSQPLSPDRPFGFGSPGLQFRTKSSGQNGAEAWSQQAFPPLPQAAAAASGFSPHINPSFSANDIPSLNDAAAATSSPNGPPPRRSSSMVFSPGAGPSSEPPPQPAAAAALDGFEPRMFPGIVNRWRAMSVAQGGSGDSEGQTGGRTNHSAGQATEVDAAFDAVEEEEEEDSDSDE